MPKKGTQIACKSIFQCSEADLKREYTKKWIELLNRLEQRKKTFSIKP